MSLRPSPAAGPPPRQIQVLAIGATVLSWAAMVTKPEAAVEIGAAWGATSTLLGILARPPVALECGAARHPRLLK
jgi:hypothetical protein